MRGFAKLSVSSGLSALALGLALSPGVARALNILSLEPASQAVRVGDVAVFELKMDF